MVPSGLANLFGILPIGHYPVEPTLSGAILIGLILLGVTLFKAVADVYQGQLYACMLAFMMAVGFVFFRGANDYGLFKLAMFCQPVLAACFSFLALRAFRQRWPATALIALAFTAYSQGYYTAASAGLSGAGVVEVPRISVFGLIFTVPKITAISDIDLMPAQGLAAIVFRGNYVIFPSVARGRFGAPRKTAQSAASAVTDKPASKSVKLAAFGPQDQSAQPAPHRQALSSGHQVPLRERIRELLNSIREAAAFPVKQFIAAGGKQEQERIRRTNRLSRLWDSDFYEYSPHLLDAAGGATHLLTLRTQFLFNASSPLSDPADYGKALTREARIRGADLKADLHERQCREYAEGHEGQPLDDAPHAAPHSASRRHARSGSPVIVPADTMDRLVGAR